LMANTDKLVEELSNKVFSLQKLTSPLDNFARMAETLSPSVERLQSGVQHMDQFGKAVREVNATLSDFYKTATESNNSLRQTAGVVDNLIHVTQRLLLLVENAGAGQPQ